MTLTRLLVLALMSISLVGCSGGEDDSQSPEPIASIPETPEPETPEPETPEPEILEPETPEPETPEPETPEPETPEPETPEPETPEPETPEPETPEPETPEPETPEPETPEPETPEPETPEPETPEPETPEPPPPTILTGVFENVTGIGYRTSSGLTGVTTEVGEFSYEEGDTITFYHESLTLGQLSARPTISSFEFSNPLLVNHFLATLDSDGNPTNGITVSSQDLQSSQYFQTVYQSSDTTEVNLDTLDEDSSTYWKLVAARFSAGSGINELDVLYQQAHITSLTSIGLFSRYMQYLNGDYSINTSRFSGVIGIAQTHKSNINHRIERYVYSSMFMQLRAGLSVKFSENIEGFDIAQSGWKAHVEDQLKYAEGLKLALKGLIDKESIMGMALKELVSITIESGADKVQSGLPDGGKTAVDYLADNLIDCINKTAFPSKDSLDEKLRACALDMLGNSAEHLSDQLALIILESDPVVSAIVDDMGQLASDLTTIYNDCKITKGKVIDCAFSVSSVAYKNVASLVGSGYYMTQLSRASKEYVVLDTAYALLELQSHLPLRGILAYLDIEAAYYAMPAEQRLSFLLQEAHLAYHEDTHYADSLSNKQLTAAVTAYTTLRQQFDTEISKLKSASQLQRFYVYDNDNNVTGVSLEAIDLYASRLLTAEIESVAFTPNSEGSEGVLSVCLNLQNSGLHPISVQLTTIDVIGLDNTAFVTNIDSHTNLLAKNSVNNKQACYSAEVKADKLTIVEKPFLVKANVNYQVQGFGQSKHLVVYDGFDGQRVRDSLGKQDLIIAETRFHEGDIYVKAHFGIGGDTVDDYDDYQVTWEAENATVAVLDNRSAKITPEGVYTSVTATALHMDSNTLFAQRTQTLIAREPANATLNVVVERYSMPSNSVLFIEPIVTGGISPYFYTWGSADNVDIEDKFDGIVKVTSHEVDALTQLTLPLTVTDSSNNSVTIDVEIDVLAARRNLVSFDYRADKPVNGSAIAFTESYDKQWRLVNLSGRSLENIEFVLDPLSTHSALSDTHAIQPVSTWPANETLDIHLPLYNGEGNDGTMHTAKWFIQANGAPVYYSNGVKAWIDYKLYSDENEAVDIDLPEKVALGESFSLTVETAYPATAVLVEHPEFNVIPLRSSHGNTVWQTDVAITSRGEHALTVTLLSHSDTYEVQHAVSIEVGDKRPSILKALSLNHESDGIRVTWKEASGEVSTYEIYRSTEEGSKGSKIADSNSVTFLDKSVVNGSTYYYIVSACNEHGCSDTEQSSMARATAPVLDGGVNLGTTDTSITASWREATGEVSYYALYRSTASGTKGSQVYSGASRSYEDTDVAVGTTYYYTASACNDYGCDNSDQHYIEIKGQAPVLDGGVNLGTTDTSITASWREATGTVSYYALYRSTASGTKGSQVYSGDDRSYEDTDVAVGTAYYYTASACNDYGCEDSDQHFIQRM